MLMYWPYFVVAYGVLGLFVGLCGAASPYIGGRNFTIWTVLVFVMLMLLWPLAVAYVLYSQYKAGSPSDG